mmetsp:Transcript_1099/g.2289  ORF Transcript_1099/g.2289 Transcript_1099/m.2289 type:complete len:110 (+) Transcript_1099:79-408(+)
MFFCLQSNLDHLKGCDYGCFGYPRECSKSAMIDVVSSFIFSCFPFLLFPSNKRLAISFEEYMTLLVGNMPHNSGKRPRKSRDTFIVVPPPALSSARISLAQEMMEPLCP